MWTEGSCSNLLRQQDVTNLTTEDVTPAPFLAAQCVTVTPGPVPQIHHCKHPHTIHHSLICFCLPPLRGKRVIQTTEGVYWVLTALHLTHTHINTHRFTKTERGKKKISANWDSHLFDAFSLLKSSATATVFPHGQTLFFLDTRVKMRILLTLKYLHYSSRLVVQIAYEWRWWLPALKTH